jgi:PAS domain S-box-containing protein
MKLITTPLKFLYLVFLTLSLFLFLLAYYFSSKTILESFKEQIENHYEITELKLNSFKNERYKLLHTLVNSDEVSNFLENNIEKNTQNLFVNLAKSNSLIMQMRILDLEGDEIFRLEQKNHEVYIVEKSELQNKKHRYYFQEFMKLPKNSLGISKLDLNIENKKIEIPFNPTVRLGMPIYIKNEKKAILIINYQMSKFLEDMFNSSFFDIYLLDENGFFITHEKKEYQWSRFTNQVRYYEYFSDNILSQTIKKQLNLWGSRFYILYNPRENSSILTFINYSWSIGIIIAFAVVFLILPFLYTLYLNFRKIRDINFSLEDTKKQIEAILDNTSDAIILIDLKGIIQEVNQSAQKIFGYDKLELIGRNINILVPEPHHAKHDEYIEKHDKNMRSKIININRELYGLHKDGSFINIGLTVTKVDIDSKQYFIGTIQDLSKEQKSRKLFENVFSETSIGIALVLSDGSFWRINSKFCEIVEYSYEELINLTFQDITHKDDLEKDISLVKKVLNKEIKDYSIQKRYITKSGRVVWVKLTVVGVFSDYDKNQFDYFIATVDDISKQVMTQEKLQEAEKIAQIGHWYYNLKTNRLEWSDNMKKIFGKTSKNFNHSYDDFIMTIHKDDRDYVNEQVNKSLDKQNTFDITYRIVVDDKIYTHFRNSKFQRE